MRRVEALLFMSCMFFMAAFLFTALFWLIYLNGYVIFIEGSL